MKHSPYPHAMVEAFEKKAVSGAGVLFRRASQGLRGGPGAGALVGAGLGAAAGAYKERQQGGSGLGGAVLGGVGGGLVGAGAGGASRVYKDTKLLNPSMSGGQALVESVRRVGGAVKRYGQRQVHGFTGAYKDKDIGLLGRATAKRRERIAKLRFDDRMAKATTPRQRQSLRKAFDDEVKFIHSEGERGQRSLDAGVTSLPGLVRGFAKDPRQTAGAIINDAGGMGAGLGLGVGLPVAASIPDLARGDESAQGGRSMTQKIVGVGTDTLGGAATMALPTMPMLIAGEAVTQAGQYLTKPKTEQYVDYAQSAQKAYQRS
jgi:hypothetical protein